MPTVSRSLDDLPVDSNWVMSPNAGFGRTPFTGALTLRERIRLRAAQHLIGRLQRDVRRQLPVVAERRLVHARHLEVGAGLDSAARRHRDARRQRVEIADAGAVVVGLEHEMRMSRTFVAVHAQRLVVEARVVPVVEEPVAAANRGRLAAERRPGEARRAASGSACRRCATAFRCERRRRATRRGARGTRRTSRHRPGTG